jgi:hypothetical protein
VSSAIVSDEPVGDNCAAGGKRIETGVDADGSGTLVGAEIAATNYVCNGINGMDGEDGTNGEDGEDGTNGEDGENGFEVLVTTAPITTPCASGGHQLSIGLDNGDGTGGIARNGILEAGEVDKTVNLCNGADGQDGQDGAGGVHLFDANGFDLGRLASINSGGFGANNTTLVSNKGYLYALSYQMTLALQTVYYASSDCSGSAFGTPPLQFNVSGSVGGPFALYDGNGWLATVPGALYQTNRSYGSYRGGSTCQVSNGTTSGFSMQAITAAAAGTPSGQPALPVAVGEAAELIP